MVTSPYQSSAVPQHPPVAPVTNTHKESQSPQRARRSPTYVKDYGTVR